MVDIVEVESVFRLLRYYLVRCVIRCVYARLLRTWLALALDKANVYSLLALGRASIGPLVVIVIIESMPALAESVVLRHLKW